MDQPGPTKPYLVRSIYDWSIDEGLTPQVMVDVHVAEVSVPLNYVKDGKIVLNLHPNSIRELEITNQYILFSARFAGKSEEITLPMDAVMAIYARENGQGIIFQADGSGIVPPPPVTEDNDSPDTEPSQGNTINTEKPPPRSGSHLKVVK